MIDGVEVLVLVADDDDGIRETTAAILRSVDMFGRPSLGGFADSPHDAVTYRSLIAIPDRLEPVLYQSLILQPGSGSLI